MMGKITYCAQQSKVVISVRAQGAILSKSQNTKHVSMFVKVYMSLCPVLKVSESQFSCNSCAVFVANVCCLTHPFLFTGSSCNLVI